MTYIVVSAANGRSYYLAKSRIGGGYSTIATFLNEGLAKDTAVALNAGIERSLEMAHGIKNTPKLVKGGRR